MVYEAIKGLVQYGLDKGSMSEASAIYTRNQTLNIMGMNEYEEPQGPTENGGLEAILKELLDCAADMGALRGDSVVYQDLLGTKLTNCLMPRSGEVVKEFWKHYEGSPGRITGQYYGFSQDSDYIRRYRITGDMKWTTDTRYGTLDITINLSKPGKNPKAIATVKLAKQSGYPKCRLRMENVEYAGRTGHPARSDHRIVPITISDSQ